MYNINSSNVFTLKSIRSYFLALVTVFIAYSSPNSSATVVYDFEDSAVQYPAYGGVAASYATQGDAGVTRNMLKLVNGPGADWWSGVTLASLPAGNDFLGNGMTPITMRVYAEQNGDIRLDLEADGQGPAVVSLAVTQGWNNLSFDFSGVYDSFSWHKIQIRPDWLGQADNAAETIYYIDDVTFPGASILDSDGDGVNDLVDDLPYDATETVDSDGDGVGDNTDELPNDPAFSTQAYYNAVQAIPASPVPTAAADSVLSIFSNAYTDLVGTEFNPGWGQATQVTVADDVITYTGLNYQGTQFANSDVSGYGYINVDFYTADSTVLKFTIISPGQEKLLELQNPIVTNQWNSIQIPLMDFDNVDLTDVFQFKFDGNGTVLVDNLYFGGTAPAPVDSDGDGVVDYNDAFPFDASETVDTDFDGVGDNADVFPNDASETVDTDGDGVGDNSDYAPNHAAVHSPPATNFCATEVTHFNIAGHAGAILLTVENSGANSITVTASAADDGASALDFFEVFDVYGGGSAATTITDGVATTVISWAAMPATTSFNVLWSDDVFGGNMMVNSGDADNALGYVDTSYTCSTPVASIVFDFEDNSVEYPSYGGVSASYATQDDAGVTRNMLKLVNGADSAWWSGVTLAALPAGNDFLGDGTATMRVYAEQDGNLNLELEADDQGPAVVNLAVAQGWNDLSFDFSGADAAINWHKIQIRPDAAGQISNAEETIYYIDDVTFLNARNVTEPQPQPQPSVTLTVTKPNANEVRLTGPWWNWNPYAAPAASNNGDGTWSVTFDPAPTEEMEYLWVADGVQENLVDNAIRDECHSDIDYEQIRTDYQHWTTRVWHPGSSEVLNIFNACSGSPAQNYPLLANLPSEHPDTVLSVFSPVYGNLVGTDFNPNWGQTTQVTVGDFLTLENLNYQGIQFQDSIDVSGYEYLHLDVYTYSAPSLLEVTLIQYDDMAMTERSKTIELNDNGYGYFSNSIKIPLNSFVENPWGYEQELDLSRIGQLKFFDPELSGKTYFIGNMYFGGGALTANLLAPQATEVRLSGAWWNGWEPHSGPVATNNGDGTWTVVLDSEPTENMHYVWVVDGVIEDLVDNAANGECPAAIETGIIDTDYSIWAHRIWTPGSGDIYDKLDACDGYVTFTVSAPEATSVRLHSSAFSWDINHPDGTATNNGDGTWTVILDTAWGSDTDYLWVIDGINENLLDDYHSDYCENHDFNYWVEGINRIWRVGENRVIDVAGQCSSYLTTLHDQFPTQVNVTFQVDMTGLDTTNGVSVMGGGVFGQAGVAMSDDDGDNVWTVTTQLNKNTDVMFRYRNTTAYTWDNMEFIVGDCGFGEWNDRQVMVAETDITLPVVSFGSCVGIFSEAFGGAAIDGSVFTFPAGAEAWGGFANMNTALYPITISEDSVITFTGSVPAGGSADVRFKLERLAWNAEGNGQADTEPSFFTEAVTVSGADAATYSVNVPSQGANTFSSFLLYLDTRDVAVSVTDIAINAGGNTGGGTPVAGNLVTDGAFDAATSTTWYGNAYNPVDGANQTNVGVAGNPWDINLSGYVDVAAGQDYTLSFDVTGADRTIVAGIGQSVAPYLGHTDTVTVSASTQTIVMHLTAKADGVGEDFGGDTTRVIFDMGADAGAVSIDNVSLTAGHNGTVNLGGAGGGNTGSSTSSVTFSVDMTGVDLQGQVPTVNGAFNNWCGDCSPMTDYDNDDVWTFTVDLAQGDYEYKYALGAWVSQETVPADCDNTLGNNRSFSVTGTDAIVLATDAYNACPGGTPSNGADPEQVYTVEDGFQIVEAFSGAEIDGSVFTFPSYADPWAGFANMNTSLYPITIAEDSVITFTGSVPAGGSADVRFRFEFNPHPDVDPSFNTEAVTVSGAAAATYSVNVPSQGANTFSSFIMYVDTADVGVSVTDIAINAGGNGGDTGVSYTVSGLPAGTSSVRIHSEWFGWDINHPEGVAIDNGDGTWTATLDPAWSADTNYKWFIDGTTEEDLLDDVVAGTCSDDINTDAVNWANRWWRAGSGDATDVFGQCDAGGDNGGNTDPSTSSVTFSVDMTGVDLQGQVPTVNGAFNNWCGDCSPMTDDDGDNVWTITIDLENGVYDYKFALGAWVAQESVPEDCGISFTLEDGTPGVNRIVVVEGGDITLEAAPWSGCAAASTSSIVTFSVDMTGVDLQGQVPTVNGTFNSWCGECSPMTDDDADNVWTIDIELADESYEYKFALGAWFAQESVPGACAFNASAEYVNRAVTVDGSDVVLATTPWSGCPDGTVVEPESGYTVEDGFQFVEAFGDTTIDGSVFTFPTGAQSWGGFANMNTTLYPMTVAEDSVITFTGSVPAGGSADVRFRFEFNPYPDVDPSFNTAAVTVSGAGAATYSVNVPSQGANTFSSFIMYLDTRDVAVSVTDVAINTTSVGSNDSDNDGVNDDQDAFPNDASETADSDNDGVGNNADTDDDGDGVADTVDGDPLDPSVGEMPQQLITVKGDPSASIGGSVDLVIEYDTSNNNATLAGLGVSVHYDSSSLTFTGFADVLAADNISSDGPFNDYEDLDANPATDKYVSGAWASIFASWPGELPAELLTLSFDVADTVTGESTPIGFSSISNAAGYIFSPASYDLPILVGSWDFDEDGNADALTDGLLLLRYAFGLRGDKLADDAVVASGSNLTAQQIQYNLERSEQFLDIDNNGTVDALTDGLILMRYLFGLRGEPLTIQAIAPNAQRLIIHDIEAHIQQFMP